MKKVFKLAAVLGGLLGAGSALALPSSIWFDGYCDGITGIVQNGDIVTGTWDLTPCDGVTTYPAVGQRGNSNGKAGQTGFYDRYSVGDRSILVRIDDAGTFEYHDNMGNYINSGTWTAGGAAQRVMGGVSSTLGR